MTVTKYEIIIAKYKMHSTVPPIETTHLGYRATQK